MDNGESKKPPKNREGSGRELARKTGAGKNREAASDKHGRSTVRPGGNENREGPGKNKDGTREEQTSELHHATNLFNLA